MTEEQAALGKEWILSLFDLLGITAEVDVAPPAEIAQVLHGFGGDWLTLDATHFSADQLELFLAGNGDVLDAIQYLINATLNLGKEKAAQSAYTVELAAHRTKRYLTLAQMAQEVAAKVRETQQEVEMPPLPPAERRLIHTLLAEQSDLATESRGQEPHRCLVVSFAQPES